MRWSPAPTLVGSCVSFRFGLQLISIFGPLTAAALWRPRVRRPPTVIPQRLQVQARPSQASPVPTAATSWSIHVPLGGCSLQPSVAHCHPHRHRRRLCRGALNYYNLPARRSRLASGLGRVRGAGFQLLIEFQIAQFFGAHTDLRPSSTWLQRLKSEIMLFQR